MVMIKTMYVLSTTKDWMQKIVFISTIHIILCLPLNKSSGGKIRL